MKGIYCYKDKENNGKIVYIGKDSNIDKNKRHKDHTAQWSYNNQQINKVIQNNPSRYKYNVLVKGNISEKLLNACKQGYVFVYSYYETNIQKAITSTSIDELKDKVLNKELEWYKLKEVVM